MEDNILRPYLQPLWYNRPQYLSNSVKKTQNKGYYGVQGHSRSSRSVPIESPYATSYQWLIVMASYLVRFRSYRSLFKFCTPCVFEPPFGGLGTRYNVHLWLIGKRVVDFLVVLIEVLSLDVTAESLRAKRDRKLAISLQRGMFDPKFEVQGVAPTNHFWTVS